jgi:hypothetical protein
MRHELVHQEIAGKGECAANQKRILLEAYLYWYIAIFV